MNNILATRDSALMYSRLATAMSRAGHYNDALTNFRFGEGSPFYEANSLGDHATALRARGRCDEAVALRLSGRVTALDEAAEIGLYLGAVDDLVACGRLGEAEDLAWEALAVDPDDGSVQAALSEIHRKDGRTDDADFHLALAVERAPGHPRTRIAQLGQLVELREWQAASVVLRSLDPVAQRHPAVFFAQVRALAGQRRIRDLTQLCMMPSWQLHEDVAVQETRAVVFEALGQPATAREIRERLSELGVEPTGN